MVIHQYAMMGLTVCSCAALVAVLYRMISACFKANGTSSAMVLVLQARSSVLRRIPRLMFRHAPIREKLSVREFKESLRGWSTVASGDELKCCVLRTKCCTACIGNLPWPRGQDCLGPAVDTARDSSFCLPAANSPSSHNHCWSHKWLKLLEAH